MAVEREVRRLQALQAAMITIVDRSCSYLDDQYHSVQNWVRAVSNTSKGASQRQVQTARMFVDLPAVGAAAAAGLLGPEQIRLLMNLHANDRCRPQLPAWEQFLLDSARTFVLHDFRQVCQRWELAADPDGAHRDHQASRDNRHVKGSRIGAGFRHLVEGDTLTGEIIHDIIKAHAQAEYDTDVAARAAIHGDDAARYPLARTAAQRMYDGFYAMCLKAADTTQASAREPLVVLFTTPGMLQAALRAHVTGTDGSVRGAPGPSPRLALCETASGAPVDPRDLALAAIHGQILRVVSDPVGTTINLGRKSRLFTGAARQAVLLSGDRCTGPGCHIRHKQIQIDHLNPWAMLGPSDQHNGGPMCPRCNRAKQVGRFSVKRDETGWHYYRPDGTEIAPRSPP